MGHCTAATAHWKLLLYSEDSLEKGILPSVTFCLRSHYTVWGRSVLGQSESYPRGLLHHDCRKGW